MTVINQIIDLNSVAMMGGTTLDRFYVTPAELRQIFNSTVQRPTLSDLAGMGELKPGLRGYIDGVAIIVREAEQLQHCHAIPYGVSIPGRGRSPAK